MRNVVSLVINIAVVIITVCVSVIRLSNGDLSYFKWFTTLSNIFVAICCAIAVPFNICSLIHQSNVPEFPHWLEILKFSGTLSVTVTMVTVFTFLNFLVGLDYLLSGVQLYLHLITPVLAILACCVIERLGKNIGRFEWLWGFPFLALYSLVYLVMVLFVGPDNGGWTDFYGFNKIEGMWPISLTCMWAGTTLLSFIVWKLSGGKGRKA